MSTEKLGKSSDRIREGRKTMLETEELGVSILHDLHQQRQSLLHAHNNVRLVFLPCQPRSGETVSALQFYDPFLQLHAVDDNIGRSKKILTNMSRRMSRNKWIIGTIIALLVIVIVVILYFKLTRRSSS